MVLLSVMLMAMFITMALIPVLKRLALRLNWFLDIPNARKVHSEPIPKVGGLAMAIGVGMPIAMGVNGENMVNSILIGSTVIVLFGLVDDIWKLSWRIKMLGQIIAALVVIFYGGLRVCSLGTCLPPGFVLHDLIALPLSILAIVGVTNAINLADGLDGLAGGIALLTFLSIGFLIYHGADLPERFFALCLCAAMIGAIFGFLRFNTHPATVFMGDTGSQLLGFTAISLALHITQKSASLSPLLPLLLLGFPVLDALTVMFQRMLAGRPPFRPDKNHFHHKLLRLGLSHSESVAVIYAITALLGGLAYVFHQDSDWLLLCIFLGFAVLTVSLFTLAERRGFQFHRDGFFDIVIKRRARDLLQKLPVIRICFPAIVYLIPLLFIVTSLMIEDVPAWVQTLVGFFAAGIVLIWILKKDWLDYTLRAAVYLMAPIVLYLAQFDPADWVSIDVGRFYNLSFVLLALGVVLTLKFTRRKSGFKASPTDLLIIVLALVVPRLVSTEAQSAAVMPFAMKLIVLFFGCDILLGELRGNNGKLAAMVLAGLGVLAGRGLM